ncbi:MAG: dienelactone hydrolase family protein [Phenylobacterium sp.]
MIERQIDIATRDGATTTFVVHPDRGGPHPVIVFFMDAPAIREELRDMARRLASGGYYVLLPNLYYRAGVMEIGPISPAGSAFVAGPVCSFSEWITSPGITSPWA